MTDPEPDNVNVDVLPPTRRWVALVALLGATFVGTVNNSIVNVALPSISNDLNLPLSQSVWMITAFALSLATTMPLAGRLGDVFGPRRVFLVGAAVFAGASVVVAVAPNLPVAVLGRVVQGASGAPVLPCIMSTISRIFPEHHRGRAVGLWAAVNAGALAAGPGAGGWIIELAGWRAIFWATAPLMVAVAGATALLVPPDRETRDRRVDVAGGLLLSVVLFGCVAPISLADQLGIRHPAILLTLAGVVAAGWGLRKRHRASTDPFVDIALIRSHRYVTVTAVAALQMVGLFGVTLVVPVYLVDSGTTTVGVAGTMTALLALTMFVASSFVGRLAEQATFTSLATTGGTLMAVGVLALVMGIEHRGLILAALVVCGTGISLIQTPATVAITLSVPRRDTGMATGMFNTARFMAGSIGAAATATLYERGSDPAGGARLSLLAPLTGALGIVAIAAHERFTPR